MHCSFPRISEALQDIFLSWSEGDIFGPENGVHSAVEELLSGEGGAEGEGEGDIEDHGQCVLEVDVPGEPLAKAINVVVGRGVFESEPKGSDNLCLESVVKITGVMQLCHLEKALWGELIGHLTELIELHEERLTLMARLSAVTVIGI